MLSCTVKGTIERVNGGQLAGPGAGVGDGSEVQGQRKRCRNGGTVEGGKDKERIFCFKRKTAYGVGQ